ncbi:NUDIX domain-containing protein [Limnohabitans sp. 2KL-27]|uniref:NUDIX domain-containing protein n=1 Tax=Limnohabitans sp. 2KL-27 TaxID=1100705 RepID=UPI00351339EF
MHQLPNLLFQSASKRKGKTFQEDLWVVAAVIWHGNQIFAAKRTAGGGSALKWEFPGGRVEAGESAPQALQREILEELGIRVEVGPSLGTFTTPLDTY